MSNLLYQNVAADIEQKILNGEYPDGSPLPSERNLAVQYGVSRNVLREAIKMLSEKKLITNFIGKGNYVTLPDEDDTVDMVEYALNVSSISMDQIVDARESLEYIIGLRIIGLSDQIDLTPAYNHYELMQKCLNKSKEFLKLDTDFHILLADLCQNTPLKIFYQTLSNTITKQFYYGFNDNKKGRESAQEEHLRILNALKSRDEKAYKDAIHLHLGFVRERLDTNEK